ncbi:hypothetical protein RF11_10239 [Thelohanellus kitauei]|uniref:Uncharacterized protein n=1 Tax=Thelohanellus kitauei TaxID=669202 RepID=A0A0C2NDC8_THEKT|nr:hypothetical protein RF11_10239 [Thelohanellus kitauei]
MLLKYLIAQMVVLQWSIYGMHIHLLNPEPICDLDIQFEMTLEMHGEWFMIHATGDQLVSTGVYDGQRSYDMTWKDILDIKINIFHNKMDTNGEIKIKKVDFEIRRINLTDDPHLYSVNPFSLKINNKSISIPHKSLWCSGFFQSQGSLEVEISYAVCKFFHNNDSLTLVEENVTMPPEIIQPLISNTTANSKHHTNKKGFWSVISCCFILFLIVIGIFKKVKQIVMPDTIPILMQMEEIIQEQT